MTCAACVDTIENHLINLEGVTKVSVSLMTSKGIIEYDPDKIGIRMIIEEVESIGFEAKIENATGKEDIRKIIDTEVFRY
jgi:Cu+-exporting ATPase